MSIYGALMSCGIPMAAVDETDFGLYLEIAGVRARRRRDAPDAPPGTNAVTLRRGSIDQIPGW